MNQKAFQGQWDHFRQIVGIGNRLIDALPEDKLDAHPIPKMRTPKELVVHQYGMLRSIAEGTIAGEIKELDENTVTPSLRSKADLVRYCGECWTAANKAAQSITDEKLNAMVKTPWGISMPGFASVGVIYDEFVHHRGQMFTYVRALGGDVPMMWDFEHNAAEFRPPASARA
jgi:uncharacterized damage-inducible protein DinB